VASRSSRSGASRKTPRIQPGGGDRSPASDRPWEARLTDEDRAVLAAGGFGARQPAGRRRALLVVDAQHGFVGLDAPILDSVRVYPTSVGARAWRAVERIADLLALARRRGIPVLFTQSGTPPGQGTLDGFAAKVAGVRQPPPPQPHPAYAIVGRLAPGREEIVIPKRYASAFFGTPLPSMLHRLAVDQLVVCGFTTSGCVRATVVDAASYHYPVTLVADACADRLPLSHDVALLDVDGRYGDVVAAADAVRLLRGA
jgi:maleamate amidohydrolase